MDNLKYYSLIEFEPDQEEYFGINLAKDFPGLNKVVMGSQDYDAYDDCTKACLDILRAKQLVLNKDEVKYGIFFEKNQFNGNGNFEENEVVKIYVANSEQTVYNSILTARVFFVKKDLFSAFYFDAPSTLQ
jgi:hypothetical protein